MYIIRLESRASKDAEPVLMWLRSTSIIPWGDRADALRFATKGEARRAAASRGRVVHRGGLATRHRPAADRRSEV
jgi:hypothetical protein